METWVVLSLLSALFLGLYDIAKKQSVSGNAVPAVLFLSVLTAAIIWGAVMAWALAASSRAPKSILQIVQISPAEHVLLIGKSAMVATSWTFAFFALKHLPISIASPIRATSPLWTILVAVCLMGERPELHQWLGIGIVLSAFFAFSMVGLREGIRFDRNRWVVLMMVATLVGAGCGLYDKYLLQTVKLHPVSVQAWFSIYLVPVLFPLFLYWWVVDQRSPRFQWRWSIPLIAVFLLFADFAYFAGLADDKALISVVSLLRRSSVLIAFGYGVSQLKEKQWRSKLVCLFFILLGVGLLTR